MDNLSTYRYAFAREPPAVDSYQDISNAYAVQMGENENIDTTVTFTRPTTSEDSRDVSVNDPAGIYILHAWGMEVNFNESDPMSIAQHTNTSRAVSMRSYNFLRCGGMMIITNCIKARSLR